MVASEIKQLSAIEAQTRRGLILARLRQAISSGELPPGIHLAETELSEALGVSRGTLREALRHLQQQGLLVADARGRLSVRVVTRAEVAEIFAVRLALESLALRAVCASDKREDAADDLERQLEPLRAAAGQMVAQLDADLAFHERLCELSSNETLLTTWRSVSGLARAAITAAGTATALHNMSYERHLPIVNLIRSGDVAGGERFLAQHMDEAAARIAAQMDANEKAAFA